MRGRLLAAAATAVLVALVLAACSGGRAASTGQVVSPNGKAVIHYPPAKRKKPITLHGPGVKHPHAQVRVSDYPGKVVVLNIWGSWCPPCRAEAGDLEHVYEVMKPKGMRLVGVDVQEPRQPAEDFMANHHLSYPSIHDQSGRALLALHGYPLNVPPMTIVLDRAHRVAAIYLGQINPAALQGEVAKLLGSSGTATRASPGTS
jgi:thiol-disulfide isomerase/thioredoxin